MINVLMTMPHSYSYDNDLEKTARGFDCRIINVEADRVTRADLEEADAVIGNVALELLTDLPRLKWVQLDTAGADSYARLPIFHGEGAPVLTNATGAYGTTLAEHVLGLFIMLSRNYHLYRDNMRTEGWKYMGPPETINGKKVLIMGMGDIGMHLTKLLNACGAKVYGIRRTAAPAPEGVEAVYTMESLRDILPAMDMVALCLPNGRATVNVINRETLALMKPTAFVVNVGRGPSVNSDDLAEALNNGVIAGAGLDVTDPEPLPKDHPLWKCRNCIITSHSAGWYLQRSPYEGIIKIACANLGHFLKGEALEKQVDLVTGYTKKQDS